MKKMSLPLRNAQRRKFTENKAVEYSSVQKAIGILLSFIPDNKAMGNQELSKSLGMNKSTVSRLIARARSLRLDAAGPRDPKI